MAFVNSAEETKKQAGMSQKEWESDMDKWIKENCPENPDMKIYKEFHNMP